MASLIRLFACVFVLVFSGSSLAVTEMWRAQMGTAAGYASTLGVAMEQVCSKRATNTYTGTPGTVLTGTTSGTFACPTASSYTGSYYRDVTCPVGEVADEQGVCHPPPCPVGNSSSATYWDGRFSTSALSPSDPGYTPPAGGSQFIPTSLCDGTCKGSPTSETCSSEGVNTPVSCTATILLTGETCTGGNGDAPVYDGGTGGGDTGGGGSEGGGSGGGGEEGGGGTGTCTNGATDYPTCTPTGTGGEGGAEGGGTEGTGTLNCPGCATEATLKSISNAFAPTAIPSDGDFLDADYDPLKPDAGLVSGWFSQMMGKVGLAPGGQCGNAVIASSIFGYPVNLEFIGLCNSISPIINWFFWMLTIYSVVNTGLRLSGAGTFGGKAEEV